MVLNSLDEVKRLVESGYALQALHDLMSEGTFSGDDASKLEDVVNRLEILESEVRRLRQSLSLRLRQRGFEKYIEYLKQKQVS